MKPVNLTNFNNIPYPDLDFKVLKEQKLIGECFIIKLISLKKQKKILQAQKFWSLLTVTTRLSEFRQKKVHC